jgi:hypothetical protein
MKITKSQLKQIIKEELESVMAQDPEEFYDMADKLDLFELPAKLDQVANLFTHFNVEIKPGLGMSLEEASEKIRQVSELLKTQFLDF